MLSYSVLILFFHKYHIEQAPQTLSDTCVGCYVLYSATYPEGFTFHVGYSKRLLRACFRFSIHTDLEKAYDILGRFM